MHLVQIFLPLADNEGKPFGQETFLHLREELAARFGGLTAYIRSPAQGIWKAADEEPAHDEIVIYEVIVPHLDRPWWSGYREKLEVLFRQESMLIRANSVELL